MTQRVQHKFTFIQINYFKININVNDKFQSNLKGYIKSFLEDKERKMRENCFV